MARCGRRQLLSRPRCGPSVASASQPPLAHRSGCQKIAIHTTTGRSDADGVARCDDRERLFARITLGVSARRKTCNRVSSMGADALRDRCARGAANRCGAYCSFGMREDGCANRRADRDRPAFTRSTSITLRSPDSRYAARAQQRRNCCRLGWRLWPCSVDELGRRPLDASRTRDCR